METIIKLCCIGSTITILISISCSMQRTAPTSSLRDNENPNAVTSCVEESGLTNLVYRIKDTQKVYPFSTQEDCEKSIGFSHSDLACTYFRPGMPLGQYGDESSGWRPTILSTGVGLGRGAHRTLDDCVKTTRDANNGIICTYTLIGYKPSIVAENGYWCGSSSKFEYCRQASMGAGKNKFCYFPSNGDGSNRGWVLGHFDIRTKSCVSESQKLSIEECNKLINLEEQSAN